MPKLTDESRSEEEDESDFYSPPASTVLNSSSGLSDDHHANVNDPEDESGSQVLLDGDGDGGNRMVLDTHDSQDRRVQVVQVRNKKKKSVRLSCS